MKEENSMVEMFPTLKIIDLIYKLIRKVEKKIQATLLWLLPTQVIQRIKITI
jgi:hypothetical protein